MHEQQALELRLAGHTYDAIALQLGYASRSSAYRAVGRAFQRIRREADQTAETLRALEDARYDRMLRAIDAKVQQGDLAAMDRALRISKARRELWGLDVPAQRPAEDNPGLAHLTDLWRQLRTAPSPAEAGPEPCYDAEGEIADDPEPRGLPWGPPDDWRMLDEANRILDDAQPPEDDGVSPAGHTPGGNGSRMDNKPWAPTIQKPEGQEPGSFPPPVMSGAIPPQRLLPIPHPPVTGQEHRRMCGVPLPLGGITCGRCVSRMLSKPEPPRCEACQRRIPFGGMGQRFCCPGCLAGHPHSAGCALG